jgi:hypothetical protein
MYSDTRVLAAFEQLGRLSLRDQSMETFLQRVCDLAVELLPGDLVSSISLVKGTAAWTSAYTGQLALDCDERQYAAGHGPCLHAATSGELTEIPDLRAELRSTLRGRPALILVDHADLLTGHDDRAALASLLDDVAVGTSDAAVLLAVRHRAEVADLLPPHVSTVTLGAPPLVPVHP